jgi:hypothetical protein
MKLAFKGEAMGSWTYNSVRKKSLLRFSNEVTDLPQVLDKFIWAGARITNTSLIAGLSQGISKPFGFRWIPIAALFS